jgi:exportin-1
MAQEVLTRFKDHPDAWTRVDKILEHAKSSNTKFFALQVLDPVIQYRWKALPRDQCDAIRNFIVDKVVTLSSNEQTLRSEKVYLQKLDTILVQV